MRKKAPNQKSNASDDNINKSSKAPATEKKPKKPKKTVKQNDPESTEKKPPTKVQKQEIEIKKCRKISSFFGSKAGSKDANDIHETISDSNNSVTTKPTQFDNDSIVTDITTNDETETISDSNNSVITKLTLDDNDSIITTTTTTTTSGHIISDYNDDDDAGDALFIDKSPKNARLTIDDFQGMEIEIHSTPDNEITKESEDPKRPMEQPNEPNKRIKLSHELQRTCDDKIIKRESKDKKSKPKRTADDIDQNSSTSKISKSKSKNPNQSDTGLSKARSSRVTSISKSKLSQSSNENASSYDLCGDSATGNTNVAGGGGFS